MALGWMNISNLSFNSLLLLERVQIEWLFLSVPERALYVALKANPIVKWYFEHKCPEINDRLQSIMENRAYDFSATATREAELSIMEKIEDWLVYAVNPSIYDNQEFLKWDSFELLSLADYNGKVVLDIGAGTGRLAFAVASRAKAVYCVEPVGNMREYIKKKANQYKVTNVYAVDGLITNIPFADGFSEITMAGHVFGDELEKEYAELMRVTKSKGKIILCPGNIDKDNEIHSFLLARGFDWSRFEEPTDGIKRKYWKERGFD